MKITTSFQWLIFKLTPSEDPDFVEISNGKQISTYYKGSNFECSDIRIWCTCLNTFNLPVKNIQCPSKLSSRFSGHFSWKKKDRKAGRSFTLPSYCQKKCWRCLNFPLQERVMRQVIFSFIVLIRQLNWMIKHTVTRQEMARESSNYLYKAKSSE